MLVNVNAKNIPGRAVDTIVTISGETICVVLMCVVLIICGIYLINAGSIPALVSQKCKINQ